jgi:hypothetical protein
MPTSTRCNSTQDYLALQPVASRTRTCIVKIQGQMDCEILPRGMRNHWLDVVKTLLEYLPTACNTIAKADECSTGGVSFAGTYNFFLMYAVRRRGCIEALATLAGF